MTDSSGNSIGTIGYLPFGSARSASGAIPTDKKFTGQRLDGTGLYYYGARYYDPTIGRFISPDTVISDFSNPQALNRYSYVYNNPLKYNDPSGHFAWLAALAVVNVVVNYAGISYDVYQLAQNPSLANLGWLALDLFDSTPTRHGALNQGAKALEKAVVKEVAEQAGQEVAEKAGKELAEEAMPLAKKVHGNTAGDQPATFYAKLDPEGNLQKWGISQDTTKRYSSQELAGGRLRDLEVGPRLKNSTLSERS